MATLGPDCFSRSLRDLPEGFATLGALEGIDLEDPTDELRPAEAALLRPRQRRLHAPSRRQPSAPCRKGVLYLENELATGAFTPAHLRVQDLLLSQAAISIENARLYGSVNELLEEQISLTRAHRRFVPHQFLEILGRRGIDDVILGDSIRKEMSVLFTDMREFTRHVGGLTSMESIEFINRYLSHMEPPITEHGGFVDSYIGDAIMALFEGTKDAVSAALSMLKGLQALNEERSAQSLLTIKIGIGINTGDLTPGTIGGQNRIKCGVIGDSVNLAARIESLTRTYGTSLLISNFTLERLPARDVHCVRLVDKVYVKGRDQPVTLYEIFDADTPATRDLKLEFADRHDEAIAAYYERRFDVALRLLSECQAGLGEDPIVSTFMSRCWRHLADPPGDDWSGIERLDHK